MARQKGPKQPKGPKWAEAPEEVLKLLARVIDEKFPGRGLHEAGFKVLMKNGISSKGRVLSAKIKLLSAEERFETGKTFRININSVAWEKASYAEREQIFAEQLSRCDKAFTESGETRWFIADYEVQVNPEMIRLYGLYTPQLRELQKAIMQLDLGFDEKPQGPKAA